MISLSLSLSFAAWNILDSRTTQPLPHISRQEATGRRHGTLFGAAGLHVAHLSFFLAVAVMSHGTLKLE